MIGARSRAGGPRRGGSGTLLGPLTDTHPDVADAGVEDELLDELWFGWLVDGSAKINPR